MKSDDHDSISDKFYARRSTPIITLGWILWSTNNEIIENISLVSLLPDRFIMGYSFLSVICI